MSQRRSVKGSSLVEVLVASTILVTAMVGIVQLLLAGSTAQTRGNSQVNAVLYAQQTINDYQAMGYERINALGPGKFDGGFVYDTGGRRYGRVVTVINTLVDAGWPSYEVDVRVEAGQAGGGVVVMTAQTFVSYTDGGM
jgi:Tfp pilus assembly protein PilV